MCPEAWAAMERANAGWAPAYGDDHWTQKAADAFRALFETGCEVFFVFNGTAANSLALAALCQSFQSVICAATAHVETAECGAPEFFSNGAKLLTVTTPDGKLTPEAVEALAASRGDIHFPRTRVVSITQATETGQVYTASETGALAETCRRLGLRLHMDGARFANACAALDCRPADLSWRAGVDVLCFGGAKNGLGLGEAVIFFDPELARDFDCRCKQAGQLASKMRFLSAPWLGLIESGAWLRNARHGNLCARRLAEKIRGLHDVAVQFPVEANAVFLSAPAATLEALRARGWRFYSYIAGAARFMFAWDADPAQVDALARDIAEASRRAHDIRANLD